jgi:tetratricopeptide (TPR) repeat protein
MAGRDKEIEARARFLLGSLLAEIHSNECAAELLGEAVAIDPGLVESHVALGFVLGQDEDFIGMLEAFREAVGIDPAAARAAAVWEPDEMEQLWAVLRPGVIRSAPPRSSPIQGMEDELQEAGRLTRLAGEHVGAGRDAEAVAALGGALRLDPKSMFAVALLAFTCLLMRAGGGAAEALARAEAVLREMEPGLAELLFES